MTQPLLPNPEAYGLTQHLEDIQIHEYRVAAGIQKGNTATKWGVTHNGQLDWAYMEIEIRSRYPKGLQTELNSDGEILIVGKPDHKIVPHEGGYALRTPQIIVWFRKRLTSELSSILPHFVIEGNQAINKSLFQREPWETATKKPYYSLQWGLLTDTDGDGYTNTLYSPDVFFSSNGWTGDAYNIRESVRLVEGTTPSIRNGVVTYNPEKTNKLALMLANGHKNVVTEYIKEI
jgi:hypothetical protein